MKVTTSEGRYVSGWCGNGTPWGHARCASDRCECPHHEIERAARAMEAKR